MKGFVFLLLQGARKAILFVKNNFKHISYSWAALVEGNVLIGSGSYIDKDSEFSAKADRSRIVIGNNTYIGKRVVASVSEDNLLVIGDNVGINNNVVLFGDIKIGSYSKFAFNIYISSGKHFVERHPAWLINDQDEEVFQSPDLIKKFCRAVEIHEDVWIGNGVVVMSGVTIGRGAVVGSNAVVTEDVFPYTIVGGVPAKRLKTRLDFIPQTYISSAFEKDLPYFYEGFYHERRIRTAFSEGMLSKKRSSLVMAPKGSLLVLKIGGLPGFLKNKLTIFLNGKSLKSIFLEDDSFKDYEVQFHHNDGLSSPFPFFTFEFQSESLYSSPIHNLNYGFVLKEAYLK